MSDEDSLEVTIICNDVDRHFPSLDHLPHALILFLKEHPESVLFCTECATLEAARRFN